MKQRRRPGVWVEKVPWPIDIGEPPMLKFRCGPRLRSAKFQHRKDTEETVILHPSTKFRGKWQLSRFDAKGPWGDTIGTCDELVNDLSPRRWRLRRVIDR